mmetsp:Transcript_76632/g.106425  ORF Transcript_76632/g.106425 Transcript_76632/m.106425 type:complete len:94 (-) Transcript_76632:145-426(-)
MASAARSIFSGKGSFWGMAKTNPEVLPVVTAAALACCGGTYCLIRSAVRPDVVWTGHQDDPWNRVEQGTNYRFKTWSHMPANTKVEDDLRGRL